MKIVYHIFTILLLVTSLDSMYTGPFTVRNVMQFNCLPLSSKFDGQNILDGTVSRLTFINETNAAMNLIADQSLLEAIPQVLSTLTPQLADAGLTMDDVVAIFSNLTVGLDATWNGDNVVLVGNYGFLDNIPAEMNDNLVILGFFVPYLLSGCRIMFNFDLKFSDSDNFVGSYDVNYGFFCNNNRKWNAEELKVEEIETSAAYAIDEYPSTAVCMNSTGVILAGARGDTIPTLPPSPAPTASPTQSPTPSGSASLSVSVLSVYLFLQMFMN